MNYGQVGYLLRCGMIAVSHAPVALWNTLPRHLLIDNPCLHYLLREVRSSVPATYMRESKDQHYKSPCN